MRRVTSGIGSRPREKEGREGRADEKERKGERGVGDGARRVETAHVRVSLKRRSREWRVETILDRSRASCRQISWRTGCAVPRVTRVKKRSPEGRNGSFGGRGAGAPRPEQRAGCLFPRIETATCSGVLPFASDVNARKDRFSYHLTR